MWLKAWHLIGMVTWFAGLFYLPRLFVYHAMSDDQVSIERFKVMERKLFFGITTPGLILTDDSGRDRAPIPEAGGLLPRVPAPFPREAGTDRHNGDRYGPDPHC